MRGDASQTRRASNLAVRIEDPLGNAAPPVEKSVNFTLDDASKDPSKAPSKGKEDKLAEDSLFVSERSLSPKHAPIIINSATKAQVQSQFSFAGDNTEERVA